MKRGDTARNVAFNKEAVVLACEWDGCDFVCKDCSLFYSHVSGHLEHDIMHTDTSQCPWRDCSAALKSTSELQTHVLYHAFHTKIKCYGHNLLEREKFQQQCLLDKQTRNLIPETPEIFECHWDGCDMTFTNPESFYDHVSFDAETTCLEKPRGSVACLWSGCEAEIVNFWKLKDHLRTHTQEKKIACPTCGGMFSNRTKLIDHFSRQNERPELCLSCSYCGRTFSSERLLRDHMRHHVNQYKCPLCDMTCPTPSALKYHMQWRHTNARPYACDQCDYSAKQPGDLRKHLEGHAIAINGKPCPFSECQFVARSSYLLRKHVRAEHLDCPKSVYMCHLCRKQYTKGNSLSRHLVSQHRFKWPSGHKRFNYSCQNKEGNVFVVQTVRYESIELTEAEPGPSHSAASDVPGQEAAAFMTAEASQTAQPIAVPVVLVGADVREVAGTTTMLQPKLVRIVEKKRDGSTQVQLAQVVAEEPPNGQLEPLCD